MPTTIIKTTTTTTNTKTTTTTTTTMTKPPKQKVENKTTDNQLTTDRQHHFFLFLLNDSDASPDIPTTTVGPVTINFYAVSLPTTAGNNRTEEPEGTVVDMATTAPVIVSQL